MNRVIIVRGQSNSGKSQLLLNLHTWIFATYSPTIIYNAGWTGDLFQIFTIGSIKIGYFTAGDEGTAVQDTLNDCISYNCDLIIGACRGKGATYSVVKTTLVKPAHLVNWHVTYKVPPAMITSIQASWLLELKALLIGLC